LLPVTLRLVRLLRFPLWLPRWTLPLRLTLTGASLLVELLPDLPGHLQVLLGRLESLRDRFAELRRRVLLEHLQRADALEVGQYRVVHEDLVEFGPLIAPQLLAETGPVLLGELLLELDDIRGRLPGTEGRCPLRRLGLRAGLRGAWLRGTGLRGAGLRPLSLRLTLLVRGARIGFAARLRVRVPRRRAGLAQLLPARLPRGLLQPLNELPMILNEPLCELFHLLRLSALLRELRQGNFSLIVDDQHVREELIVHAAGLSGPGCPLPALRTGLAFRLAGLLPGLAGLSRLAPSLIRLAGPLLLRGIALRLLAGGGPLPIFLAEHGRRGQRDAHAGHTDDAAPNLTHGPLLQ
jgi:hypothetical protein